MPFLHRLTLPKLIVLDGATGSELDRRAVDVTLPLWSARALIDAPDVLFQIHTDYLRAGAEVITANTFRTHRRSLAKGGLGDQARAFTLRAVQIARQAIDQYPEAGARFVAGSMAPLEDCYAPELVPAQAECEREHAEIARHLKEAGADLILVETMNTVREARAAAQAAIANGLPAIVSFVCDSAGRLLSGETVTEAVRAIAPLGAVGLAINCTPSATIHAPFAELCGALRSQPAPVKVAGLYANIGHTDDVRGWVNTLDVAPLEYARLAAEWIELGANLVGGCCGTTPSHIAALRMLTK